MINRDPIWVETAYLAIVRRRQMIELRQIPESEWPEKAELEQYTQPREVDDINYYEPDDFLVPLGLWLRDRRIRERHELERQRLENRGKQISQQFAM